ncbi:hypothetical protein [Butyrivibrio proteoclasticus]|uniref:hypothetical protein n=1 Tax=Butyrivibrio proteoclasticus TaxID=43305 RepID=UPI0012DC4794|nr:hypothetical protein [Butyrivibrio proteoclasticus]
MDNFFLDDSNPIILDEYQNDNFIIKDTGAVTNNAIIFFSSNGIYTPNSVDAFIKRIKENDYYDWLVISKHRKICSYYKKIVFVRDIYKQWYVTGINNTVDSIDKMIEFLSNELAGYNITTCGSSAGGYAATILGIKLGATRIINSCGQFNLYDRVDSDPLIAKYQFDNNRNKYYDIKKYLLGNEKGIYYLYPAYSKADVDQNKYIKDVLVKRFVFNGNVHGQTVKKICYPFLLTMDNKKLDELCKKYDGTIIDSYKFMLRYVPIIDVVKYIIHSKVKQRS